MSVNPVAYDDFDVYQDDNSNILLATVVSEESEWRVVGGHTEVAQPGDVVVALSPHTYEVHSGQDVLGAFTLVREATKEKVREAAKEKDSGREDDESIPDSDLFDPAKHTAAEVRAYLSTADEDERERVYKLEQSGLNRSSALK